ncbi:kelch domain-containing protein 7B [Mustela putorius furo]|uniref:Kelch domain-containing protein 7B n=1 Tax=Mustela putorius furo TaxID=9669 RepID=A0A8U0SLB1_MUSPF|nr:kelch domain-containing protein 7B [Mustela putorius furo]
MMLSPDSSTDKPRSRGRHRDPPPPRPGGAISPPAQVYLNWAALWAERMADAICADSSPGRTADRPAGSTHSLQLADLAPRLSLPPSTMVQGTLEPDGLGGGWDGEDDSDGAVLALLALAVVGATALALHWFGSGQDQEAAGPAPTTPGAQPSQAGGARPALPLKSKVSGGVEGHSSGQGKLDSLGRGQRSLAAPGTQDQKLRGAGGLAATALPPLKTPGEVTLGGTLRQQQGHASAGAPQSQGREPLRPGTAPLGQSKVGEVPGPILIRFTPRSPGRELAGRVQAGGVQVKVPTHQSLLPITEQDTSPWQQGAGRPGSLERGPGCRRWQVDPSSGDRSRHVPQLASLRLGAVVSVWDAVDAASSLATGSQKPSAPRELPPSHPTQPGPRAEGIEKAYRESILQAAPVLALESREARGPPAPVEGWPWERKGVLVTRSTSQAPGSTGPWPERSPCGHSLLSQGQGATDPNDAVKVGANGSGDGSFFSPGLAPAPSSGSRLMTQEPSVALKDKQEGQIPTSWENLISMVLRSHPFPRQDRPQGRAPKAALESPRDPSTGAPSENRESGSPPERAAPSLELREGSSDGPATGADAGGLAEAGREQPQSRVETEEAPAPDPPSGRRGDAVEEKREDPVPPGAARPPAAAPRPEPKQPGPEPSAPGRGASQPVPHPRRRSACGRAESAERGVGPAAPRRRPGEARGEQPGAAGRGGPFPEAREEAGKPPGLLQRPGSRGLAREPAPAAARPPRLDLGNCLDVLAFAQQHGEPGLARETYELMSDNLLRVLGDPSLYRQLSGADRERILSLRTGRGRAVLGVLVLPSLYQVSRSGLARGPCREEAPAAESAAPPPRPHLHVFDARENTWRPLTQVPEEAPLRGCGLCTMHNYLFLAGGIRGSGAKAVCSNEVFCYNPLTNIWSQVRPMQQARAQLKLVALDGLLYAIGGECLYSMERYDPRTDTWTLRAPLPAGTFPVAHEAVACRGDIYVTGGHLFYRLLRYSPGRDAWDECPYSASHRRSSDMVALGGFLYRFDLLRGVGAAVMRYNTVTGSWSRAASLRLPDPAPLHCTTLGDTIYCLNHQVTATFTVSEGTAQFQARELQPFPLGSKGVLCPFILTLPATDPLQTAL